MRGTLSSLFWDFYAFCYDGVRELKPYQDMLEEVLKELDLKPGMKVLDAGCGTGNLEALIAERHPGVEVVAVDFSPAMLRRAKKKVVSPNISFEEADINKLLPFPSGYFDRVVTVNAVHALENPLDTLAELRRIMVQDGKLVLIALKDGFHIPLVLKAHMGNANVDIPDVRWMSKKFGDWCWLVLRSFGFRLTTLQFILIAVCNKIITQKIRGLAMREWEEKLYEYGLDILHADLIYGGQDLFFTAKKTNFAIKIAKEDADLEKSLAIRTKVFLEENKLPLPDDRDEFDTDNSTAHFLVFENGEAVGTFRLLDIVEESKGFRGLYKLPPDPSFQFKFADSLELSRVAILPERRGGPLFMLLVKYVNLYARSRNRKYICGTMRIELMQFFQKKKWQFDFVGEPFIYHNKWRMVAFISPVDKNINIFFR